MKKTEIIIKKSITFCLIIVLAVNLFGSSIYSKQIKTNTEDSDLSPEVFSWQDINQTDFTTSVKNQELCKSDAAFALVACLETMIQYKLGYPFYCDLSEAHLFYNNNGTFENGVNISRCADYLKQFGVPDEGCFPYPERFYDPQQYYNLSGWQDRSVKIDGWEWVENNVESIKNALVDKGPVCALIKYPYSFLNYKQGIFNPKGKNHDTQWVSIVGYNDDPGYWECKNSWGDLWGEYGWFKIPYDSDMINESNSLLVLNGTTGNLNPDVPIIKIFQPRRGMTYSTIYRGKTKMLDLPLLTERFSYTVFNNFLSKFFPNKIIDIRTPRVKKSCLIEICAVKYTGNASVFIDNELVYNFSKTTFIKRVFFESKGLHTLKVVASNAEGIMSVDIREFLVK